MVRERSGPRTTISGPSGPSTPSDSSATNWTQRQKWIKRSDGVVEILGSKVHDVPVAAGDLLHFVTWGGGGWDDPLAHDPSLVRLEVLRGLISVAGKRRYGMVCN